MKLQYKHISESVNEIMDFIKDRRTGRIKSLRTKWHKFNNQMLNGVEPNVIITIAGISGSGKSAFINSLETDLIDLNPNIDVVVLSFNFEMLSSRQVGRKLSYKLNKTVKELYSGNSEKIAEEDLNKVTSTSNEIKKYPIYYVDKAGTIDQIEETIDYFQQKCVELNKWLIVILDHTLLTRNKQGASERETLYDLQKMFMIKKKVGLTTIFQISQMNRNIEMSDRITNPAMHYPIRSDIFGSDAVYQASDYLIVLHRPELLGIEAYGPKNLPVKDMIYMHFLKVREGEPKILVFENNLKYNTLNEYNPQKIN